MSLSEESLPREVLVCEGCNKSFAGLHPTNYDHHIQYSASCRLKRAIQNIKRKREKGLPDPQPPPIELRPLVEDDPIDFVPNDDDPDPEQPVNEPTEAVDRREWDSTEQFVSWVKRAKLSQSQTDEMLNLFRDQRMDMREALENIQSHRDVDRYLMSVIVGENARMVDLSRPGKDPGPILLTYKPLLDVVKKMAANAKAVEKRNGKEGKFVLKPVIQEVKVMERQADGTMKQVDSVREYDHPSTGTWWNKMQEKIDKDPAFQGDDYVVLPIIMYLDKTTMDGLRRVSVFPVYVSLANFSWEFYNERGGLELVALLPQPKPDPDWPHPGYKKGTDAHRDLKRHIITSSLAIIAEGARLASHTGIDFVDPHGVKRKGVPQLFCISKDLGEASTISNVKCNHCDSCLVPPSELNRLSEALAGAYAPRLEPAMRAAVNAILDLKENPEVPRVRVTEEVRKHGVHPQMPWFFGWRYGNRPWNAPYLKMVPDDLHTVYGGVLGSHFLNVLDAVAAIHPDGKAALLALMNVRLHQIYLYYNPGLRLPASKEFFTERYSVPNYEWKAVMQVLPLLVAGLFRSNNRDVLVEWAVAFVEWVQATFWVEKGIHNDNTLAESDRLLLVFDDACTAISKLQASAWNFRKYHDLAKFTATVRRLGATRWTSTERGEHEHHWVKIWWAGMNGKNVDEALFQAWLRAIALDTIEAQRAQVAEVVRQRGKYNSAIVSAVNSDDNKLPLGYRFATLWSNMLVDVASPSKMIFRGHKQRKAFLELLRVQPLLSKLPAALGTYFAEHLGNLTGAALRRVDPLGYLRNSPHNINPRVYIVSSCYIVPHEGGRGRLQTARAVPSFHGRSVFSDVAVAGVDSRTGAKETWYGRAMLLFKAYHRVLEWDEETQKQVWRSIQHDLVFLRWFRVTGYTDAVKCDIVQWEPTRSKEASVAVEPIESLISVEMMLPKKSQARNMELWYRNKYYR